MYISRKILLPIVILNDTQLRSSIVHPGTLQLSLAAGLTDQAKFMQLFLSKFSHPTTQTFAPSSDELLFLRPPINPRKRRPFFPTVERSMKVRVLQPNGSQLDH